MPDKVKRKDLCVLHTGTSTESRGLGAWLSCKGLEYQLEFRWCVDPSGISLFCFQDLEKCARISMFPYDEAPSNTPFLNFAAQCINETSYPGKRR